MVLPVVIHLVLIQIRIERSAGRLQKIGGLFFIPAFIHSRDQHRLLIVVQPRFRNAVPALVSPFSSAKEDGFQNRFVGVKASRQIIRLQIAGRAVYKAVGQNFGNPSFDDEMIVQQTGAEVQRVPMGIE